MPGENYQSWSVTAADNGNADTSIIWSEGQTRASVNNSSRSEMAAHAKNRNLLNGSIATGGSANAHTFTSGVGYTAIPTGLVVKLKIGASLTNTASVTLNMDGIGDTGIKTDIGENLRGGELVAGCYTDFLYDGTNWIFLYSREFIQNQIDGGGGVIIGKQVFSTPGTFVYIPTVGTECCIIECIGGGGGGGGVLATSLGTASGAGGGGAGSRSLHLAQAADIFPSVPVVVGAGGTAGAAGGPGGGAGGDTGVGGFTTTHGGSGGSGASGAIPVGSGYPYGGPGGGAGSGNMAAGAGAPGGPGFYSLNLATTFAFSGVGGSTALGGGGVAHDTPNGGATNGSAGSGYGSGGSGGTSSNGGGSATGGAGAPGIVIITEFAGRGAPGRDGVPGAAGPIGPTGPSGPGTGDVLKSGTPVAGQIAQWVDASHIKGIDGATFTTGDVKLTFKTTADTGWVLMDDGSIGNAASGATTRANADTSALFALLWNNIAALGVADSAGTIVSRGASAAVDYAANRRLALPALLGRALAVAGSGFGLTPRTLGAIFGEENHTLSIAELASHGHGVSDPGHAHVETVVVNGTSADSFPGAQPKGVADSTLPSSSAISTQPTTTGITIQSTGSGTAHNTMQPTTFLNVMIKL